MNIFNKVTLKSLQKNKVRTGVTIIGIALSAAMICAVTTSIASFQNFLLQNYIYSDGSWHGYTVADRNMLGKIQGSDRVAAVVSGQYLGYAKAEGCTNPDKPYLYLMGASDGFAEMMPVHVTSGRYPKNQSEILLPNHLKSNGGVSHTIGEQITLTVGDRISEGEQLYQDNAFFWQRDQNGRPSDIPAETLQVRGTRTFTVVGFYERPSFEARSAPGYTAITLPDPTATNARYDVYFQTKKPNDVYSFMNSLDLTCITNTDVLMFMGISRYSAFYSVLYGLSAIVMLLIVFGSVSLIYNAFSISVSERTKQFGLLSSIGATRRQLRKSVFFEAFAVSLIGIPLGILVGIAGIGVTLLLIGDRFVSIGTSLVIPMRICVSPLSVVLAILLSLVTVLISAWIPSKRAMKITAVEAIRQSKDIKPNASGKTTSKLTYKLFGLPGVLASKYFKRSRRKYRATIVSLFMSVVLFVSASAFTGYLTESVQGSFATANYDLRYVHSAVEEKSPDHVLELLRSAKAVTGGCYVSEYGANGVLSREELSTSLPDILASTLTGKDPEMSFPVYFMDDDSFRALLKENGLSEEGYFDPSAPKGVVYDSYQGFDNNQGKVISFRLFRKQPSQLRWVKYKQIDGYYYSDRDVDESGKPIAIYRSYETAEKLQIPITEAQTEQTPLQIGAVIEQNPIFYKEGSGLNVIYPYSARRAVMGEEENGVICYYTSSDHRLSYNEAKALLESNSLDSSLLMDVGRQAESDRNIIMIINVFAYGFIVLISLIAAANVFNTISTNIALRRREFAMLKSVGMTRGGFNRMMNYECILYGSRALLYGLPVSIGITWLIYRSVQQGFEIGFHLPWAAIGISVASVFLVVFATMMYAMRKIKKDNPIDALKNENL